MKGLRWTIGALAALAVASCGTARRTPAVRAPEAAAVPTAADSVDVSRERAQSVLDYIDDET